MTPFRNAKPAEGRIAGFTDPCPPESSLYDCCGTPAIDGAVCRIGRTQEAAEEIIRICKDKVILREYFESRENEFFGIMIALFIDDRIQKSFLNAERCSIRQEERAAAQKAAAIKMLKKGTLSIEETADFSGLSVKAVKELAEKK